MKRKSRTVVPVPQDVSPLRHLPLVDLLVDTRTELFELAMRAGLRVFTTMLEEDRTAICGPRGRTGSREGLSAAEGCADMPRLVAALRARDQRLGLGVSAVNVA